MTLREIICSFQIDTADESDFTIRIFEPRENKKGQLIKKLVLETGQWDYLVDYPEFARRSRKYRKMDNLEAANFHVWYRRDKSLYLSIYLAERYTKQRSAAE